MIALHPPDDPARHLQEMIARAGGAAPETRTAFRHLHERYLPFSYALASRKAHPDDVDDILQEIWVAVWRRLQDPEPIERFLSLLEAICRNKVADSNERRFRRKRSPQNADRTGPWLLSLDEPLDSASGEGDRWADCLEAPGPLPETTVLERERTDELWRLLERLPENWRLAVTYRYFNGMSVSQTAAQMRTTEDSIKKYVFRAVRRLREWMQADPDYWLH